MSPKLAAPDLLEALHWRYATKVFDPAKPIDPATWQALLESLRLAPSSYGLQPWKFLVVEDPAVRRELRAHSWNQSQVTDAAKLVVLLARRVVTEADVDRFIALTGQVTGTPPDKLANYRNLIVADVVHGDRMLRMPEWTVRQVYIAFGQLMTSAALLGVDTCPLEGLDPLAYERVLGLEGSEWKVAAACALGHRGPGDRLATSPKVRFPSAEVVEVRT